MKKGVSLIVAVAAITIMIILISAASVVGSGAIATANFEEYKALLNRVSDNVNEYYVENGSLPLNGEVVSFSALGSEFANAIVTNNDAANTLYVIDISKLKDSTITKGNGTVKDKDVFLVAANSNNVYYMKGFKYKSKVYFGL